MSDIIVTAAVALAVTAFIITFAGLILAVSPACGRPPSGGGSSGGSGSRGWTAAIRTERTRGGFP